MSSVMKICTNAYQSRRFLKRTGVTVQPKNQTNHEPHEIHEKGKNSEKEIFPSLVRVFRVFRG